MPKKISAHIRLGRAGEKLARLALMEEGMEILAADLHLEHAQVDLLARDGLTFVIVEVKTMRTRPDVEVHPWMNLDEKQKDRLVSAGYEFRRKWHTEGFPLRFDLVEVFMNRRGPVKIKHHAAYFSCRFRKSAPY